MDNRRNMDNVVIAGGGAIGLAAACALADQGVSVTVLEPQSKQQLNNPNYDGRETALTHLSHSILQHSGTWQRIAPKAISFIHHAKVINGQSPHALHFDKAQTKTNTLGYMVSNHVLRKALYHSACDRQNVDIVNNCAVQSIDLQGHPHYATLSTSTGKTLRTPLLIAADGRFSTLRRMVGVRTSMYDFGKMVIVCKARVDIDHNNTAYECFLYGSTLAILPLAGAGGHNVSVVITVPTAQGHNILKQSESAFNTHISTQFKHRLGAIRVLSERFSYPLVATWARSFVAHRFALIGDAAVGMHPVTAMGFNLGLRGQSILSNNIARAYKNGSDIGAAPTLNPYHRKYTLIAAPFYFGTNALVTLYTNDNFIPRLARSAIVHIGNRLLPAKRLITHQLTNINTPS